MFSYMLSTQPEGSGAIFAWELVDVTVLKCAIAVKVVPQDMDFQK